MSINEIQDEIVEEFSGLVDSTEKYKYLIALAKDHRPINQELKTEKNAIKGCQSNVWLVSDILEDGKMIWIADTDIMITKGILSLILRIYNNQKPSDIIKFNLYFLDKIGLKQALSPQRANGVGAIVEQIRKTAKQFV
jgi:cysteine desulfuration protein SufE